ncbi:glycerol-3-phosphate acyltransferase 1, mitochondrial [Neocloeon triangulifer]|uniref:glycerol-3-phosphate acyltransferase 1, mitochondrial n=1 Tax=Neocloeon triangulifer TaxID=2078957 RepID=UPI00286ECB27|nr:glycerol-3-phosphate acyltransferase 1, mitochondrial [Neocloeon triangulifer]
MISAIFTNMGLLELVLLGALLYWLFGKNVTRAMADVLSSLQHIYQNWERRCHQQGKRPAMGSGDEKQMSSLGLRAYAAAKRAAQRQFEESAVTTVREQQLYRAKSAPLVTLQFKSSRRAAPLCCSHCTPTSRENGKSRPVVPGLEVRNILRLQTEHGFVTSYFKHIIYHVWEFHAFPYPKIFSSVLKDERVLQAVQKVARMEMRESTGSELSSQEEDEEQKEEDEATASRLAELIRKHHSRAYKVLKTMGSNLNDFLLRLTSYVLYKLLPMFLTRVVVNREQVQRIKEAADAGIPLIFLPNHRSHLDYILMTFILVNAGIKAPLVAAGDNLNIPLFGWLLRGLGAFYIKRKIDPTAGRKDLVYRAVLHTYMVENLRAGHYVEFFIEGGRTRTGKACMPKGGLLSVIVDTFMDGVVEDALLVPVGINYEKIVDGNFVREQLGQPKVMESFGSAIRSIWKTLNSSYGMMRVDFNQPFSLREMIDSYHNHNLRSRAVTPDATPTPDGLLHRSLSFGHYHVTVPGSKKLLHSPPSSSSLYGTDVVVEEQRHIVEDIAKHIVYDAIEAMSVMSTNAVAFLLLTKFRAGTNLEELAQALDDMRLDVRSARLELGFTGDSVDVINHALSILGPGVVRRERLTTPQGDTVAIKPVVMVPNVIELSYYANTCLNIYVREAVAATALCSLLPESTLEEEKEHFVGRDELVSRCLEICSVLQFEFILAKPCQSLETLVLDTIDDLQHKGYLEVDESNFQRRRHFSDDFDSEEEADFVPPHVCYSINKGIEYRKRLGFLCSVVRPLLEGYAACATCLPSLAGQQVTEKQLLERVTAECDSQLRRGFALFEESRCIDPIRNALRMLEKWEVLECHSQDRLKVYYLRPDFDSETAVAPVVNRLRSLVCSAPQ